MKTHELAKALEQLAKLLKLSPNVELDELKISQKESLDAEKIALSLDNLVVLSRFDKKQWIGFFDENNLPIEYRDRDSSYDLLAKLLRYLDKNPPAMEKLKKNIGKNSTESPELMKAFDFLLKKQNL